MIKYLETKGKKLMYRVTGTGKPVLLVHGFGEDGEVWNNQVQYLQDKFQLIVPDLPGSGQSEMTDDMSMEGMADVLVSILENEVILPALNEEGRQLLSGSKVPPRGGFRGAVIGHSMGGYITLALVEKYPDLVSGFGLVHSSAFADSEEKKATRRKGIEFIREHGAFEFLKTATPKLFSPQTTEENPALIEKQVASLHNFSAPALVSYTEAMMQRPDRTDILSQTVVPVLFIMGVHDTAVPVEDGLKQCHLPGISYIHLLRQSGHMGMLEEPEKTNLILEKFLTEI